MIEYKPTMLLLDDQQTPTVPPYSPCQIRRAYDFPCKDTGEGNTIAIVVAYGNPHIREDVKVFNERFNLPPIMLQIEYPKGIPTDEEGLWAIATSTSVEWVHALAPSAKILLVVAPSASNEDLFGSVEFAAKSGAAVVLMSFGAPEFKEQLELDNIFKESGVVFISSSGNTQTVTYPSSSPYVIGVGGTSLQLNPCGKRDTKEIAWYNTGGGISQYEQKPPWQNMCSYAEPKTDMRTCPDISFYGDFFPGVSIYTTIGTESYWIPVGGTGISAICLASVFADAIPAGEKIIGAPALLYKIAGGCCYTNPYGAYEDITNGNTTFYPALSGYDYTTGLGSPHVASFIKSIRRYA